MMMKKKKKKKETPDTRLVSRDQWAALGTVQHTVCCTTTCIPALCAAHEHAE